jgi:hypothetical protein
MQHKCLKHYYRNGMRARRWARSSLMHGADASLVQRLHVPGVISIDHTAERVQLLTRSLHHVLNDHPLHAFRVRRRRERALVTEEATREQVQHARVELPHRDFGLRVWGQARELVPELMGAEQQ